MVLDSLLKNETDTLAMSQAACRKDKAAIRPWITTLV